MARSPALRPAIASACSRYCRNRDPGKSAHWPGRPRGLASFTFFCATAGTSAASAWNSPSTASCGSRWRTKSSACRTLSTRACCALPLVENDSMATRGSSPSRPCALRAEAMAMSASSFGARIGIDRAIGKDQGARAGVEKIRHHHQKIARRQRDAVRQADRHQAGFDHAPGRIGGAGDHGVGIALRAPSCRRNTAAWPPAASPSPASWRSRTAASAAP